MRRSFWGVLPERSANRGVRRHYSGRGVLGAVRGVLHWVHRRDGAVFQ